MTVFARWVTPRKKIRSLAAGSPTPILASVLLEPYCRRLNLDLLALVFQKSVLLHLSTSSAPQMPRAIKVKRGTLWLLVEA